MIHVPTIKTAYRPRPPRNWRALAFTAAATVLISSLVVWANSTNCMQLVIASSKEKYDLLAQIAATYPARRVDRQCVTVKVIEKASGTAERALAGDWRNESDPRPDVWSPAARTWLLLLRQDREKDKLSDILPATAQSLIQSPLVIAMPEEMARTLLQARDRPGWHDLLTLARDPQGWARFGKPWGAFQLGKTTPRISTSGLHALISLNNAAQAEDSPTTFLASVESRVLHYPDSVGTFLSNLRRADRDGNAKKYVSAIAVEEKQVFDYNRGITDDPCEDCPQVPNERLMALYPKEGTLIADHPYAILSWADDAHQQAARDFEDYLETPAVQSLLQKEGFRNYLGVAGDVLERDLFDPDAPRVFYAPPTQAALAEMLRVWSTDIRKRANALILLDIGPSLEFPATGSTTKKLDLVRRAIATSLDDLLADDDALGLWTFPTADGRPFDEVLPMARRGPPPFAVASRADSLTTITAGRALYTAIRAASDRVQAEFVEGRVNAVIVVSDGVNGTSDRLNDLVKALKERPPERRVPIFTIYLRAELKDDLRRIASESGGVSCDATDATKITDCVRNALANL
ncbi:MAG TPA: substrate-binding and VWA domain-containing protein [Candidatus Limnocylindria bacterium]